MNYALTSRILGETNILIKGSMTITFTFDGGLVSCNVCDFPVYRCLLAKGYCVCIILRWKEI